ncbi:tRNA (adenosine(37)-N6)-threonylcarbamoyltransferase complex dimerization subunit type 1 TsaB [Rhodoferax sp. TS-BS-61-7]|uniref:tRNA (adenosine(37)-N6)-threonylcarbamoyltransferase complex dimerization subunit type 1 TsaB n=1 Tax=Rhodoferax sp. TS-BS-61-7 TaxID=2094194 RepID=UPI000CF69BEC|nr:tRNA (adenosine(37)-N6)-threonylcarbamoyltransferase complex dimerization subunit type 1 TsaB [Rhodoferax sp. TS-BS-61-7]PQA78551.1 tRNA (adenosine(37)-N6)-threonylcarbamoyltransferase complex dimerization subunit type 1 TsaB [Rhodoferax sp. TS-BS-61-7]
MNLLAIDSGTEHLSIAVGRETTVWQYAGAGGARASTDLIAGVLDLLAQAGLPMAALDAMAFGAGPGSFTGLRTACSVVQGLAFGANVPVLPVDSLLAVAEDARQSAAAEAPAPALQVLALLDARMDEMYAAHYAYANGQWRVLQPSQLLRPEALRLPDADANLGPLLLAGNVFAVYAERLDPAVLQGGTVVPALPTAAAMLRLAPALLAAGLAVDAAHAMPSYIRDKVAKTTAERMAEKAAAAGALA